MAFFFRGGVHPEYNKDRTGASPVEEISAPETVIVPMLQHTGEMCRPLVSVGERVLLGQKIGDGDPEKSCPVHASVAGIVRDIGNYWHPSGVRVPSVVIDNDFSEERDTTLPVCEDPSRLTPEEIIAYAREAGIVGMGGSAFPLHAKLIQARRKKVDVIIINGTECEPLLTADHRAMVEYPRTIVNGIKLIMRCLGKKDAFVAIEANKPDAVATMSTTVADTSITVFELPPKYPQGGEKQLIKSITGREVPPDKLPMDIGCVIFNVDTCASLYRAVIKGRPLTKRICTVTGSAVANPKNLLVRLGTPFRNLFETCGGFCADPYKIIAGGPMMGMAQHSLDTPVIKSTSGLLAFSGGEESFSDSPRCIRCGRCISSCPMRLMPSMIYMYAEKDEFDRCGQLNVSDCIECGCCAYVCPAKLPLVQAMQMAKGHLPKDAD